VTSGARAALPRPALVLVTDSARRPEGGARIDRIVREAVLGGVNIVQLREKHLSRAQLVDLGRRVRGAIGGRALFFVNGDIEAAIALRADGVHLPEDGTAIPDARARVGEHMLISRAVHGVDAAVRAEREGADLLQLGTIFETASKPGVPPLGVEGMRAVCAAVQVPVIAIGGISAANAAAVLAAGAAGVAAIGAIFDAEDPRAAAGGLAAALGLRAALAAER
jgi:thiamine-phosphate pyrophosphorylase